MEMLFSPGVVAGLVVVAMLCLAIAIRPNPATRAVKERTATYLEREEEDDPSAGLRALEGSFATRVILPFFKRFLGRIGRLGPSKSLEEFNQRLVVAGRPGNLSAADFLGFRILLAVGLGVLGLVLSRDAGQPILLVLRPIAGALIGYMAPQFWLSSRISRRKDMIQRSLPDALDMLTVCVEAGLAFEAAMQRVSENWPGPLSDELARVVAEIRLGVPRGQALRRMAQRCETIDVSSFVAVLVQADSMGTSIANVIHSQADQIRVLRRQRAEEKANKAPIKVLIPMVLFIFPALFVVILGPGVPKILEVLGDASGR